MRPSDSASSRRRRLPFGIRGSPRCSRRPLESICSRLMRHLLSNSAGCAQRDLGLPVGDFGPLHQRAVRVAQTALSAVSPTASRRTPPLPINGRFVSKVRGLATRETAGWAACATMAKPDSTPHYFSRAAAGSADRVAPVRMFRRASSSLRPAFLFHNLPACPQYPSVC